MGKSKQKKRLNSDSVQRTAASTPATGSPTEVIMICADHDDNLRSISASPTSELQTGIIEESYPTIVSDYIDTSKGALGATLIEEDKCIYRVWGPHIEACFVEIGENRFEMINEYEDVWVICIGGVQAGLPYHFVIRSKWNDCYHSEGEELIRRDPYARWTDFGSQTCYISDAGTHTWAPFDPPLYKDWIIYELHMGTFTKDDGSGNSAFERATRRLDAIKSLGFNAIQVMPVQEFGGQWGYNPRLLMSIHGQYGTPKHFRQFVEECHCRSIAVIADLVLNHGSSKLNSLWNWDGYGPNNNGGIYFEGGGDTTWGRRFAFGNSRVKQYIIDAALVWVSEYNLDGLRLDSVHNMPWKVLQDITYTVRQQFPRTVVISEVTPEDPRVCTDAGSDACCIHAAYYDAIKVLRGQESQYHMPMLRYMIDIHKGFTASHQCVKYMLGSHDQVGNRENGKNDGKQGLYFVSLFGGRNCWEARAQCRMWYTLQAVSRGIPMIFAGTELHQDGWWNADTDHALNWTLFDSSNLYSMQMVKLISEANSMRLCYTDLTDDYQAVNFCHEDSHNRVIGFIRGKLLCVLNASSNQFEDRNYGVHTPWKGNCSVTQVFNSQAEEFGGWNESYTCIGSNMIQPDNSGRLFVNLPKWSVTVYKLV